MKKITSVLFVLALAFTLASCNKSPSSSGGGGALKWTVVNKTPFGTSNINSIAYGNGKWIAVGEDGKIAYANN